MGSSILQIGISGLTAARFGLETASHNISNSNTDGYSRQQISQSTNAPSYTGSGFLGQGVSVDNVRRIYSGYLNTQLQQTQTRATFLTAYQGQISQIDNLLADPSAGLGTSLSTFFAAVQDASANPADVSARQSLISTAQSLAGRFQALSGNLSQLRDSTNLQIQSTVVSVNAYVAQIADINGQIAQLSNSGTATQLPNDLLDQRDTLIKNLSKEISVNAVALPDGTLNLFMGNGQALVVGTRTFTMSVGTDPQDGSDLSMGLDIGGGTVVPFRTSDLSDGGTLGGLLAFRDNSLYPAQDQLGKIAANLAIAFNTQHIAGRDLDGAVGGYFFTVPAPQALSNTRNTGTGVPSATISDASALTGNNYRIAFDGSNYVVTNLTTRDAQTFGSMPQTVDGVAMDVTGVPVKNDSFVIYPTRLVAQNMNSLITDVRKVALAAPAISVAVDGGNSGSGVVSDASMETPAPSDVDYGTSVRVIFDNPPTTYKLYSGAGYATEVGSGTLGSGTIEFHGWSVTLTGTPAAADTFTVSFGASGSGDNRNAVALGNLETAQIVGGVSSLQGSYAQLISTVGNKAREIQVSSTAQNSLLQQVTAAQQTVSGVNLDEEAANLLSYQQSYNAASRVITLANELFSQLLDTTRN